MWATDRLHEGVIKLLLQREDIDPNIADVRYGRTPLTLAAMDGHEGAVKLLLQRVDINPNVADIEHGLTPLMWAEQRAHEGIKQLLLARVNVNADTQTHTDKTAPVIDTPIEPAGAMQLWVQRWKSVNHVAQ